jgi:hypothetical protein
MEPCEKRGARVSLTALVRYRGNDSTSTAHGFQEVLVKGFVEEVMILCRRRLREKYAAKLADTPDRHAFEVVSAPTGADGKEFKDVARAVAGMNTLDSFLRDMRTRYPDPVGDGAAGAGDKTAPDVPPSGADAKPAPGKAAAAKADVPPLSSKPSAATPGKPDPLPTGSIQAPNGPINRSPGPRPVTR